MSEYEMEMIRVLDQMGKTDWVGITVSILVPILSALVVFYLSKHQIDLESKRQYNLDTQKENQSLATKTKLDNYGSLYKELIEYKSLIRDSYSNIEFYMEFNDPNDTIENIELEEFKLRAEIEKRITNIEVLSVFFPIIKESWSATNDLYLEMRRFILYGIVDERKNNSYKQNDSYKKVKDNDSLIQSNLTDILKTLNLATTKLIIDLESALEPIPELSFLEKCKNYKNNTVFRFKFFCFKYMDVLIWKIDDFKKVEQTKNIK